MQIEVKDINKSFGDRIVLSNYSLSIESGTMVAITGKSGSGKTTLINILGLIEKPDSGVILYDGIPVKTAAQKRDLLATKIGFIFQNYGLIDDETVFNNLVLVRNLARKDLPQKHTLVDEALEKVQLSKDYKNKLIYECSGGEQQRVAIAKLLLKDCGIVFADEPTASLDEGNKDAVLKLLQEMNSRGKTIVMVTHDLSISRYCGEVVELQAWTDLTDNT